jgi:hypothetical protein
MTKQATKQVAAQLPAGYKSPRPGIIYMIREQFESATGQITAAHLPAIAEKLACHPTTVRLQFYRWRKVSNTPAAKLARGEKV